MTFSKYRGSGERSWRKGYVTANVGGFTADAEDETTALLHIANRLETMAMESLVVAARAADWPRREAAQKRKLAVQLRADADKAEAEADAIDAGLVAKHAAAVAVTEALAAFRADVGE